MNKGESMKKSKFKKETYKHSRKNKNLIDEIERLHIKDSEIKEEIIDIHKKIEGKKCN